MIGLLDSWLDAASAPEGGKGSDTGKESGGLGRDAGGGSQRPLVAVIHKMSKSIANMVMCFLTKRGLYFAYYALQIIVAKGFEQMPPVASRWNLVFKITQPNLEDLHHAFLIVAMFCFQSLQTSTIIFISKT